MVEAVIIPLPHTKNTYFCGELRSGIAWRRRYRKLFRLYFERSRTPDSKVPV